MWVMAIIAAIAVAGWFAVSCGPERTESERPLSEEEAALLAGMRERNFGSDPVALRMTLPVEGETVTVDGYLDWQVPMVYAHVPDGEGGDRLVQAIPGLIAGREYDAAAFAEVRVPEDGWNTRQMLSGAASPLETTIDILFSSLFTLTAEEADDPAELAEKAAWRGEAVIDGEPVEAFRAPIMVATEQGGAEPEALYSLDEAGDLRRFQVNTGSEALASVDFLREVEFDPAGLVPVDLLGGPVIHPEAVEGDLAETIASVRERNWSQSALVELTVPVGDNQVATGSGSVDWRTMTAYLRVSDGAGDRLLLARPGGYATVATDEEELPETPPSEGWEVRALGGEGAAEDFGPVETLVYRLLEMAAEEAEDPAEVAERAALLRVDEGGGDPVYVVEFPVAGDAEAAPGESAFRYHVGGDRLREVEMMSYYGAASAELEYEDYPMVPVPFAVEDALG
jgi:hypothetical protein